MNFVLIAFGGAFGAIARFGVGSLVTRCCNVDFPLGTLIANVVGCFLMGLLLGSRLGHHAAWAKSHLGIGFLGSFTTFSTFSAETIDLLQQGRWSAGGLNISLSVGAGLLAVAAGIAIGGKLSGPGNVA